MCHFSVLIPNFCNTNGSIRRDRWTQLMSNILVLISVDKYWGTCIHSLKIIKEFIRFLELLGLIHSLKIPFIIIGNNWYDISVGKHASTYLWISNSFSTMLWLKINIEIHFLGNINGSKPSNFIIISCRFYFELQKKKKKIRTFTIFLLLLAKI